MQVHGPAHLHGPQSINAPHGFKQAQTSSQPAKRAGDELNISDAAQIAADEAQVSGIRTELVNEIRAKIAAGTYETPENLDSAVTRLAAHLDEIG